MLINEIDFNVKVKGDGKPFIWGHGLTASAESEDAIGIFEWERFPQDHMLVRYDALGHGKTGASNNPEDYHWRNLAQHMLGIADELQVDRFVAGGQSMGCATSLYAALMAPERVERMVLMNPPTAWETRAEQGAYYKKQARAGRILGGSILASLLENKLDRLLPQWLIDAKAEEMKGMMKGLKPLKRKTLYNLFYGASLTDLPKREEVAQIATPALILAWTGDQSHPLETAEQLHELLPNSKLVIADSYEDFAQWPELIREFI